MTALCDVTMCNLTDTNQCFRRTHQFHLQHRKSVLPSATLPDKCDMRSHANKYDSRNNLLAFHGLHEGKLKDKSDLL